MLLPGVKAAVVNVVDFFGVFHSFFYRSLRAIFCWQVAFNKLFFLPEAVVAVELI